MTEWEESVAAARAEGVAVFQKNGLPIVCQRGFDGALLEHETPDHPDYKFPVDVEFVGERPDTFHAQCVRKDVRPAHYGRECKIEWDYDKATAFCATCKVSLTPAEQVHILAYNLAEIEAAAREPHSEALIYNDETIAITLYECCYTMWRRQTGAFLHGAEWSKKWRLSQEAREKIWGKETTA